MDKYKAEHMHDYKGHLDNQKNKEKHIDAWAEDKALDDLWTIYYGIVKKWCHNMNNSSDAKDYSVNFDTSWPDSDEDAFAKYKSGRYSSSSNSGGIWQSNFGRNGKEEIEVYMRPFISSIINKHPNPKETSDIINKTILDLSNALRDRYKDKFRPKIK